VADKAKRQTILVFASGRLQSMVPDIWHTEATFFMGHRYLPGSGLAGKYDKTWLGGDVIVRFQHDTKNTEDYAPRVSFDLGNEQARKLAQRVMRAAQTIRARYEDVTRDRLIAELGALVVTRAGDAWTWAPKVAVA